MPGPATLYYEIAVLGDKPIAFYRLFGNALDSGPNRLNLSTLVGAPVFGQSLSPTIFSGDGATGALFATATNDILGLNNSLLKPALLSLEAWVKPSQLVNNDNFVGGPFFITGGKYKGYFWDVTNSGGFKYDFGIGTTDLVNTDVVGVTIPVVGTWAHIVGTFDGINVRLYINGIQEGISATIVAPIDYTGVTNFLIGNFQAQTSIKNFNGTIYGMALYNYALSASQVATHYLAATAPFSVVNSAPTTNLSITSSIVNPVPTLAPLGNSVQYTKPVGTSFIIAFVDDDYGQDNNNPIINNSGSTPSPNGFGVDNSNDYFFNADEGIGDGIRCDDDEDEDEDDDEFISWDKTNTGP